MSATQWAQAWVVRKIRNDEYYDAVQTLEMAAKLREDALAEAIEVDALLDTIAPTTLEQYLEDMLDDAVNIEDQILNQ
ncbi:MAG: hypothetical protein AB3N28_05950 [Kordiimonas sp.]